MSNASTPPTDGPTRGLPNERSLFRAGPRDLPAEPPRAPWTSSQVAHIWILVIGGTLTVFGLVSAIAGRIALTSAYDSVEGVTSTTFNYPGAAAASAWLWLGVGTLVPGGVILLIELFLFAHSDGKPRPSTES
ncbi:hypothetical protein AX769_10290 [Frondihabitans sp. PAMC 28766]|uniref:hypothetical protein n=1 Tax=Frondihabitans sp. PAMC 28766 TaxID=1795630 RepID=UPI00078CDC06|nr:hypothetical protein [Frondihabitans sp. PAMC 28766]AMM20464.1 hypothetical protein AX769_10290 [Frondihabitans sp. PAMC 28766]